MKRQHETAVKLLFPLKSSRATYYSTCKTVDQSLSRVIHLKSVSSNKSACKTSPRHGITAFKLETPYFAWIRNASVIISTLISIHSKHLINQIRGIRWTCLYVNSCVWRKHIVQSIENEIMLYFRIIFKLILSYFFLLLKYQFLIINFLKWLQTLWFSVFYT